METAAARAGHCDACGVSLLREVDATRDATLCMTPLAESSLRAPCEKEGDAGLAGIWEQDWDGVMMSVSLSSSSESDSESDGAARPDSTSSSQASECEEYAPKAECRYAAKSHCRGPGGCGAGGAAGGVVVVRGQASAGAASSLSDPSGVTRSSARAAFAAARV